MANNAEFEFSRSRGVVWVCDVAGSSSRLNSEDGVEDTEAFLPRLCWTAALAVESAGGRFIKWTGDGFLAWFETPLHRELTQAVTLCLEAVWHLTVMVNVTQLGFLPKRHFRIRHGITYEQDALITKITHADGHESFDLMGRAVVLAFRLSGLTADFPGITAHRDIVESAKGSHSLGFRKWKPTSEESLKFFKGERWGTSALYVSRAKKLRLHSKEAMVRRANVAIMEAEGQGSADDARLAFSKSMVDGMISGPEWSRKVIVDYTKFIEKDLLGSLKAVVRPIERAPGRGPF